MALLEAKNLKIGFPQKPLINNLSFKITEPTFVAILGHNGCGKSTFFKSLINQHAFEGEIKISDQNINSIPKLTSSGLITLLEQKNNVSFSIPVKDLVVMGRFIKKKAFQNYQQEDYEEVKKLLATLQMSSYEEEDFLKLSGGEQQLIWLAQVLIQDTKIILLDEPTQQLDVRNKKKVFDIMQRWVKNYGKTVLCITHDINNLHDIEGYILNLASSNPALELINEGSINRNLQILEGSK